MKTIKGNDYIESRKERKSGVKDNRKTKLCTCGGKYNREIREVKQDIV